MENKDLLHFFQPVYIFMKLGSQFLQPDQDQMMLLLFPLLWVKSWDIIQFHDSSFNNKQSHTLKTQTFLEFSILIWESNILQYGFHKRIISFPKW